jgi:hypothetical protein
MGQRYWLSVADTECSGVGSSASLEWTIAVLRARDDDSWVNHFMLALIVTTAFLACLGFVLAHA